MGIRIRNIEWGLLIALLGCAARTSNGAESAPTAMSKETTTASATPPSPRSSASTTPETVVPAEQGKPAERCAGTPSPKLVEAISMRFARSRSCYEQLLRTVPRAQGRMLVAIRVGPNGELASAEVLQDEIGERELSSCVISSIRGAPLPAPDSGCVDVNVPLRFEPKQPPPDAADTPESPKNAP